LKETKKNAKVILSISAQMQIIEEKIHLKNETGVEGGPLQFSGFCNCRDFLEDRSLTRA
jgi:hypothetical protein